MDVVSIGRAFVDLVVSISVEDLNAEGFNVGDDVLLEGDRLQSLIHKFLPRGELLPGGPSANSMAMIAALGGEAAFIGKVAGDSLGEAFIKDFEKRGIDFQTDTTHEKGTACCMVFVTPDGERTLAYNPGIADQITGEDIEKNKTNLQSARILLASLTYRVNACSDIIQRARGHAGHAQIVTGLQSYTSGQTDLADKIMDVDIVIGNEAEFVNFCVDLKVDDLLELSQTYSGKIFACTLGPRGALIYSEGQQINVAAVPIEKVLDTTGAGDAWAAGFLYGRARDLSLEESGKIGAECAAHLLVVKGGRLPVRESLILNEPAKALLLKAQRQFPD